MPFLYCNRCGYRTWTAVVDEQGRGVARKVVCAGCGTSATSTDGKPEALPDDEVAAQRIEAIRRRGRVVVESDEYQRDSRRA